MKIEKKKCLKTKDTLAQNYENLFYEFVYLLLCSASTFLNMKFSYCIDENLRRKFNYFLSRSEELKDEQKLFLALLYRVDTPFISFSDSIVKG